MQFELIGGKKALLQVTIDYPMLVSRSLMQLDTLLLLNWFYI